MRDEYDRRRKLIVSGLNDWGMPTFEPFGAFYAFPNISATGFGAKVLATSLLEDAGVASIAGPDFGVLGEGYIRLSYANSQDNIARALARMRRFLDRNDAKSKVHSAKKPTF